MVGGTSPEPLYPFSSLLISDQTRSSAVAPVAPVLVWSLGLSLSSAVGVLSIQLRVHSGRARERNMTLLSHLADVPVLLHSLPLFFPPFCGSKSNPCPLEWACGECFCMCLCTCLHMCVCGSEGWMELMQENKDKYREK